MCVCVRPGLSVTLFVSCVCMTCFSVKTDRKRNINSQEGSVVAPLLVLSSCVCVFRANPLG